MTLIATAAKAEQRRSVPPLRGDAPLARDRPHAVRDVPLARRAAHERLELCLHRQAARRGDRGSGHPRRPRPRRAAHARAAGADRRCESDRCGFPATRRPLLTPPSARSSRSSTMSSGCSSPTESRTKPSLMPSSARCAGVSRWCVVVAGWVIRLLASPRLLQMRTSLSASWKRKRPALPPSTSKATSVEPPRICLRTISACGWSGRPG